jgi:hypothetical protein
VNLPARLRDWIRQKLRDPLELWNNWVGVFVATFLGLEVWFLSFACVCLRSNLYLFFSWRRTGDDPAQMGKRKVARVVIQKPRQMSVTLRQKLDLSLHYRVHFSCQERISRWTSREIHDKSSHSLMSLLPTELSTYDGWQGRNGGNIGCRLQQCSMYWIQLWQLCRRIRTASLFMWSRFFIYPELTHSLTPSFMLCFRFSRIPSFFIWRNLSSKIFSSDSIMCVEKSGGGQEHYFLYTCIRN